MRRKRYEKQFNNNNFQIINMKSCILIFSFTCPCNFFFFIFLARSSQTQKCLLFILDFYFFIFHAFFCSVKLKINRKNFQNNLQFIKQKERQMQNQNKVNNEGFQNVNTHEKINSDEEQKEKMERQPGLTGKKEWPIRILSFLFFGATVAIVYVFGMQNQQISDKYSLYVTPPGLFFTIWAVIFAVKAIVNIINLIMNVWTLPVHILMAVNNCLLIAWINVFNIGTDAAVYAAFLIIVAIIPVTLVFWTKMGQIQPAFWFTYITRNVYAFYLGWIVAATNLNFGIIIVYWWLAPKLTQLIVFWVMAPSMAIGITLLNVCRQKLFGFLCCFALWISVIWAFVGAAIRSNECLINGCQSN